MRYLRKKQVFCIIFSYFFTQCLVSAQNYHPSAEKYNLSNGLVVILEEDHSIGLVNIQLWVRAGSCYEGKVLGSGITHLVEHMVFKGEKTGASIRIAKKLQALGGELDAATSKEYTHFKITVRSENLRETMDIVRDIITKADFVQEELDKEKKVVEREMDKNRDDPQRLLSDEFFRVSYQGHPFGEPVIGHRDLFRKIDRDSILEYYKAKYIPRNMVLVVAGDFEPEKLKTLISSRWEDLPGVSPVIDNIPQKPIVKGPSIKIETKDIKGAYMIAGFYGPSIDSDDLYSMDVLAEIAGGGNESRLVKKIRDRQGLVSSIDAWSYTPVFNGILGVSADLTGNDWRIVLKNILKEMYRFRVEIVSEKELLRAKKRILRKYFSGLETISGRAYDLGSNEIYIRNPLYGAVYIRGIGNVTRDDIKKAAKKYLISENLTVSALTPLAEKKNVVKKEEEKDVVSLNMANGLKALIKEDHRIPIVTIRAFVLGGLLEEKTPGLSYLTSQIWLKEKENLVKQIEERGGSISITSGYNSIGCSMEVFKEDINASLLDLAELLRGLNVTEEKLTLVKNMQTAGIRQEEDSPYGFAFKTAREVFFGTHPYRNSILGDEKSVMEIKKADIESFFNNSFTADNMVISIFGDIDAEAVRNAINSMDIRSTGQVKTGNVAPAVTAGLNTEKIQNNTKDSVVILAFPGVSIYSEDRFAMELLAQLFSGQAGRLFETIREEEGLSYSLGALNITGRDPGSFMLYASTAPENTERVKEIFINEVKKIKEEEISEEELKDVKECFLTHAEEGFESIRGLSMEATLDELYGLGWDYYKKYIDGIKKVSVTDMKNVANKYFRDDWHAFVVLGPADNPARQSESK